MLGKLTLSDIPYGQPIIMDAAILMTVLVVTVLGPAAWFRQ